MHLNLNQLKAANHDTGPALVLAVPGSGKTTVLLNRINILLENGVSADRILSITFSKASALDMKLRYKSLNTCNSAPYFSTIHSLCYKILSYYGKNHNFDFKVLDSDYSSLSRAELLNSSYKKYYNSKMSESKYEDLTNAYTFAINSMISYEEALFNSTLDTEKTVLIFKDFDALKRKHKHIDFDDMLSVTYGILCNEKSILSYFRNKFDYIQLDEGQDTSKIQYEIIKLLADKHRNLMIVADDDQSIYGFRGAYPEGLFKFEKEWAPVKKFILEANYRSSKNIVLASEKFISSNSLRYSKNVSSAKPFNSPIEICKFNDLYDQYYHIAEIIKKDGNFKNWAILYRNHSSSIALSDVFERCDVPFYFRGVKSELTKHPVANDLWHISRFVYDTDDKAAFSNIFYKIKGYTSRVLLQDVLNSPETNVFKAAFTSHNAGSFIKDSLSGLKADIKSMSYLKPKNFIAAIGDKLEYLKYLDQHSSRLGFSKNEINACFYKFVELADVCENMNDYWARIKRLNFLMHGKEHYADGVKCYTVHSAKGLEFENVIIIDVHEGEFPSQTSIENANKGLYKLLEEERRLFYVAMTRAISKLYVMHAQKTFASTNSESRFISELKTIQK